jgi:hypothetical protein
VFEITFLPFNDLVASPASSSPHRRFGEFAAETFRRPSMLTEYAELSRGEFSMPDEKPLRPEDFPVAAENEQIVTADGKALAKAKTPVLAEEIAARLNEDDALKEQERWSA